MNNRILFLAIILHKLRASFKSFCETPAELAKEKKNRHFVFVHMCERWPKCSIGTYNSIRGLCPERPSFHS